MTRGRKTAEHLSASSISVFPNHAINVTPTSVMLPRAEAEFVAELSSLFERVYIVGFCRAGEAIASYDGSLNISERIHVYPLSCSEGQQEGLWKKVLRYAQSMIRMVPALQLSDTSYFFMPSYINLAGALVALVRRRRYALYVRGEWHGYPRFFRVFHRMVARHAIFLIVTGPLFRARLAPLNPAVELVRPMTGFTLRVSAGLHRKFDPLSRVIVAYIGTLTQSKGIADAIDMMTIIRDRGLNAVLMVAGGGHLDFVDALRRKVTEVGLEEHVSFLGHVTDAEQLRRTYELADIFVCPTIYAEGVPRVVYEAMASGTAIVATNIAGAAGILKPEENFIEVPSGSPVALADAVTRLALDHHLRARLSRNAFYAVRDIYEQVGHASHAEQVKNALLRASENTGASSDRHSDRGG